MLGKPCILSTGMSTMDEILEAVEVFGTDNLTLAHATCLSLLGELNLKMITTLRAIFPEMPIGYSGHETGLAPSYAAVALGAAFIETHHS